MKFAVMNCLSAEAQDSSDEKDQIDEVLGENELIKDENKTLIASKQWTVEDLISMAGTNGIRNFVVITLCLAVQLVLPMNLVTYEFLGEFSDHRCAIPHTEKQNLTEDQIKAYFIPYNQDEQKFSKCEMYVGINNSYLNSINDDNKTNIVHDKLSTKECREWYFTNPDIDSVVTEFNLVCDRKWLYPSTGSATLLGTVLGALCVGYLFDTYGRKFVMVLAAPCYLAVGIACSFAPNITSYIILKTLMAATGMAFSTGPLTLCFELCSPKQRTVIGAYSGVWWGIGYMAVAPITYLVRPWRYLQFALVAPVLLQIPNYWLLPESPRWLINKGHYTEALKVLKSFARSNKRHLLPDEDLINIMHRISANRQSQHSLSNKRSQNLMEKVKESMKSMTAIIRINELRPRALIIMFCWFTVSLVYYGVSVTATAFSSNKYIYVLISGFLEIPASICIISPLNYFGRRKTYAFCYIATGLFIFAALLYDEYTTEGSTIVLMLFTLIGKFLIASAFEVAFIYTNELFPTEYRAIALGEASGIGRIGSVLSPYINDLLIDISSWAPRALFSIMATVAGGLALLLPETVGIQLQDRVGEKQSVEVN